MDLQLETLIPRLKRSQNLIGFLAHVTNMLVCAGLYVFLKHLLGQLTPQPNNLFSIVEEPGLENLCSALCKIDALAKLTKNSCEFSRDCKFMSSTIRGIMKPLWMITKVSTQWNWTYHHISWFFQLKLVVQFRCEEQMALHENCLSNCKWVVIEHMAVFKPLTWLLNLSVGEIIPLLQVQCQPMNGSSTKQKVWVFLSNFSLHSIATFSILWIDQISRFEILALIKLQSSIYNPTTWSNTTQAWGLSAGGNGEVRVSLCWNPCSTSKARKVWF